MPPLPASGATLAATLDAPSHDGAIQQALEDYYNALNNHDAARMASLWASMDEVILELPGLEAARGRAAVDAAYRRLLAKGGFDHVEQGRTRTRVLGGRAEVALLETISTTENGAPRKHAHVVMHVLFKTDSGWRWVVHRRLAEKEPTLLPDGGG